MGRRAGEGAPAAQTSTVNEPRGVTDSRATMVTSSAQLRAAGRAASGGSRSSVRRWMLPEPSVVTITQWTRLSVQAEDLNSIPGWEDPLEKEMATSSSLLCPENPHGQRSLVGYSPWGRKKTIYQLNSNLKTGR